MRKTDKKFTRRNRQLRAALENLESRQLYSVATVTPQNFMSVINSAHTGDTINFTPGTYTLSTNTNGPAATFPAGLHYIGNGAVIQLSTGVSTSQNEELIRVNGTSSVTEFTGFTFEDAQLHCEGGVFDVHNNTFTDGYRGIFVANENGSHFDYNTFTNLSAEGIFGYPGNNNTYDNNRFDYVWEPIHLVANNSGTDVSNNVITHATRIGIELQLGMTNMTVDNNWISNWLPYITNGVDNHMAISCATGGAETAPFAGQGENITISGNTLLQTGPDESLDQWAKSAIEIMGNTGIVVSDNYMAGWGNGILNGVTNPGLNSSGNVIIAGDEYAPDSVPWPIASIHSSSDEYFSLSASNAPAAPSMNTSNVGAGASSSSGSSSSGSTGSTPVVTAPAPTTPAASNFVGTSPSDSSISLSWTDNSSGTATYILQRRATNGSTGFSTIATLAAGTTSYTDSSLTANWQYSYQLVAVENGVSSSSATTTVQVQAAPVVSTPVVSTPVVTSPVVTGPVVTAPVTAAATNFVASSPNTSEVDLSWTDNTSGTATYIVQRRATNGSAGFSTIATLPAGTVSYVDENVTANWRYTYQLVAVVNGVSSSRAITQTQVQAAPVATTPIVSQPVSTGPTGSAPVASSGHNNGGNSSGTKSSGGSSKTSSGNGSNSAGTSDGSATDLTHPSAGDSSSVSIAPTGLTASKATASTVQLSWTDNSSGKATFIVQRQSLAGGGFKTLASLPAGTTDFNDAHAHRNGNYIYRVLAVSEGTSSVSATTSLNMRSASSQQSVGGENSGSAPTLLLAWTDANGVELSWADTTDGTAYYILSRASNGGRYQVVARLAPGTTKFVDTSVEANWQYTYALQAVGSNGQLSTAAKAVVRAQPMLQRFLTAAA